MDPAYVYASVLVESPDGSPVPNIAISGYKQREECGTDQGIHGPEPWGVSGDDGRMIHLVQFDLSPEAPACIWAEALGPPSGESVSVGVMLRRIDRSPDTAELLVVVK